LSSDVMERVFRAKYYKHMACFSTLAGVVPVLQGERECAVAPPKKQPSTSAETCGCCAAQAHTA
jgi:hypothetical protein